MHHVGKSVKRVPRPGIRSVGRHLITGGIFAVSFAMAIVVAVPAHALAVYSVWTRYGPVFGITYENRSGVNNNNGPVGTVSIHPLSGTIPSGWSGEEGTLYVNGAVCASGSMMYFPESVDTGGWQGVAAAKNCGSGNYTTRGTTAAYNGGGYIYYSTAMSPILQF